MKTKVKALIVIAVIASLLIAGVWAATTYWSNTIQIDPEPAQVLSLSANSTTPEVGETIRFTATVDPPIASITVNFLVNNVTVGAAVTNSSGLADWDYVAPSETTFWVNASATM